jgi:hypothetical protein
MAHAGFFPKPFGDHVFLHASYRHGLVLKGVVRRVVDLHILPSNHHASNTPERPFEPFKLGGPTVLNIIQIRHDSPGPLSG